MTRLYNSNINSMTLPALDDMKRKHENGGILKYQNPATTLDLPEGSEYEGELKPAVVKPKPYLGILNTYYPIISEYPFTGHSELDLYDSDGVFVNHISKYGDNYDYNLVTNNCSDATRRAVEKIFGEKINPVLFTTPGDVQDFVAEKTGQKPVKEDVGQTALGFNIPFATAMDLKNQNLDFYIQDYLHKAAKMKKQMKEENPNWNSGSFDLSTAEVIQRYKDQKYKFQPFKNKNGGILKAQEGTGNLYAPHPLSPIGIALNQAKAMAKGKKDQQHLPPGVKEVVGPDGKKVAIRTEQPLVPLEQSIAEWLPGTGDVAEVGQIADDVKNGNFGTAALAAGLMVLPGNARKILDKFGVDLGDISTFARLSDQEWDDMYFQAIESGDNDLVQHIRDAHFKVKAPDTKAVDPEGNPIRLFHGEKDSPKYHDLRYLNSGPDHKGLGVYYSSTSKDIAKTYAQHKGGPTGQVREVYYNMKNPNVVDAEGRSFQTVLIEEGAFGSRTGVSTDQLVNRTYWDTTPEGYRKKSDKDGLIVQNVEDHAPGWTGSDEDAIADNYVTWNPYAVKSAEAIVRHPDTGEIIPISKRDNFKIPSILMGTAPMIFGLNAVSNNKNNKE